MADQPAPVVDRDLVVRVRSGDPDALRNLHDRYYTELLRFAVGWLKDSAAASDVVQDAFIAVWNRRDALNPEQNIRAYLYRVVRNGILMAHRSERITARATSALAEDPEAAVGHTADLPEVLAEEGDLRAAIAGALASLTERQRTAVTLRWLRQMSYEEVAIAMGISRQAVHALLQRTHAVLEQVLRPFRPD